MELRQSIYCRRLLSILLYYYIIYIYIQPRIYIFNIVVTDGTIVSRPYGAYTYNNTLLLIIVTVVAEESQDQFNLVRVLVDIAENNLTL